jgi:heme oxygenase
MQSSNELRDQLRQSTQHDHAQVDGVLSALDLATPRDYIRFLGIHADALHQLGSRTAIADRPDVAALVACLQSDLAFYGTKRAGTCAPDCEDSPATQLGIAYVIRGSRLGAQVLARRVAAGAPRAYLGHRLPTTWASFLLSLNAFSLSNPPESGREVIAGAKAAFGVFVRAAQAIEPVL